MTNGEKIREVFPKARIKYHKTTDLVDEYVTVFINDCDTCQDYSMDWWNAEYKEPTTKNDIGVDCIDRKKLIDWVNMWGITPIIQNPLIRHIQGMSSVTPQEPRKGHWISGDDKCPCCGKSKFEGLDADIWADWRPKYCPNCGADMRGSENESNA